MGAQISTREPRGSVHRVSAAQQRAERIRCHLADAAEEYATAVLEGDWDALGYDSVAEWAADQFGQHQFRPEARRQVAELLAARGMTTRQIAAATGVSQPTATRDLTGKSGNESRQGLSRNESNDHENEAPVVAGKPHAPVPDPVTETAQTVTTVTEKKPHACRVFVCQGCGKPDTDFSERAGKLMDELEEARAEVTRLSAALIAAGQADRGTGAGTPGETADSAHAPVRGTPELDADGNLIPDDEAGDPWDEGEFADLFRQR